VVAYQAACGQVIARYEGHIAQQQPQNSPTRNFLRLPTNHLSPLLL